MPKRRLLVAGVLLLSAALPAAAQLSGYLGVYHWGGSLHLPVDKGVERIADLGSRVARIVLTPRYYSDYGDNPQCYPGYSVPALLQEPAVQRALDNSRIQTFVLTVYDGASFGDCKNQRFLIPSFYNTQTEAAVEGEYRDLTIFLVQRYAGSGRRFIISNWESDNAVYCGAANSYAETPAFRATCDSTYAKEYGTSSPQISLEGLRIWFGLRQQGIADGLRIAHAAGWRGVDVVQAPEINMVRGLDAHGLPSVLRSVLPGSGIAWVSYSSYESINAPSPGPTLAQDIRTIRSIAGAANVIIGEAGFARSLPNSVTRLQTVINAALAEGAKAFIIWNLNDQDATVNLGIFDQNDALTSTGRMVLSLLRFGHMPPVVKGRTPGPGR